ncbi:bcl-2-like protein 10 isoform X3 [Cygnus olor]|uniref:bcl-2-like protein 10 isoform X3 n=1 Tax=Cygnus olor TaxID=8869 RepID=UPI001ADE2794|nr:bcl-2-like protein 10 isoform X3 [Cygnus olor]
MPGSLKEETALLLEDYFQHRGGGAALPPSATAATLRRAAAELERCERPFFRSCAPLARAEPREAAALLRRVAAQLEADGGLNWGRLLALVVFAGTLAAALGERGCGDGPRRLAEALAAYLAEERGEWLRAHGGWLTLTVFIQVAGVVPVSLAVSRMARSICWVPELPHRSSPPLLSLADGDGTAAECCFTEVNPQRRCCPQHQARAPPALLVAAACLNARESHQTAFSLRLPMNC